MVRPAREQRLAIALQNRSFKTHCHFRQPSHPPFVKPPARKFRNYIVYFKETYWVAVIASTSRPSLNPSRRACTGVVGSGP
jgi:hypothetical protein